MTPLANTKTARVLGASIGGLAALAVLVAARPAPRASPLPASARFALQSTGELELTPSGTPFLTADALSPGGAPAASGFQVRNQTGETVMVGFTALPNSTALDGALHVRLTEGAVVLSDTTLQGLRAGSSPIELASGAAAELQLEVWLGPETSTGYEGVQVSTSLVPSIGVAR